MLSKETQAIQDLKEVDGRFDHEDIIQHLVYAAEILSDKAVNSDSESDMQCALINITCMIQAVAYITIIGGRVQQLEKGGKSC